jgi:hypothetical protein
VEKRSAGHVRGFNALPQGREPRIFEVANALYGRQHYPSGLSTESFRRKRPTSEDSSTYQKASARVCQDIVYYEILEQCENIFQDFEIVL